MITSIQKGENVLGLQPDDRMPHDWLRMVSRVFASYRKTPLQSSVVAYIDGLNLSITGTSLGITEGMAFVDDQFIGFIDDSVLTLNPATMPVGDIYDIVLCYTWVNIMPPQEPSFDMVPTGTADPEHHLVLGQVWKNNLGDIEFDDNKRPWFTDTIIGDTTIDGPANPGSIQLPYIIQVNNDETMNVGWALDFQDEAGAHNSDGIESDVRLHTAQNGDDCLYIDDNRILTAEVFDDAQDTVGGNIDKFAKFDSNLRIIDDGAFPDSNSGCVNYELQVNNVGSKLSQCSDSVAAWANYADFDDPTTVINELKLGDSTGDVTINDNRIWTSHDSPNTIYFLGQFPSPPSERGPADPLQDGDQYYNVGDNAYYYRNATTGAWTRLGQTGSIDTKQYFFRAKDGQYSFECAHDPGYVSVNVAGVELHEDEYVSNNGISIVLNTSADLDEAVIVRTIFGSGVVQGGTRYNIVEEEVTSKKIFPMVHNPLFTLVSVDGLARMDYVADGDTITMAAPVIGEFKAGTVLEDEGRLEFEHQSIVLTVGGSHTFPGAFASGWTLAFVNGYMIPSSSYSVINGSSVDVNKRHDNSNLLIGDEVQAYSMTDLINDGKMSFYIYENRPTTDTNTIDWLHNPVFTIVTIDGLILDSSSYSSNNDGTKIFFDTDVVAGQIIKAYSQIDTKS